MRKKYKTLEMNMLDMQKEEEAQESARIQNEAILERVKHVKFTMDETFPEAMQVKILNPGEQVDARVKVY